MNDLRNDREFVRPVLNQTTGKDDWNQGHGVMLLFVPTCYCSQKCYLCEAGAVRLTDISNPA